MSLAQKVLATIKKYKMIDRGDRLLLAVSGGPDSMALMHILFRLRDELNIGLHVFHLNHCFRGQESLADSILVKDTAAELDIPCTVMEYDVPGYCAREHKSSQEGAREVRYDLISRVAARTGAARVALGHHADDQAETIILNFLRGSGLTGLKGFLPVRDDFYIRPLLYLRRREIEDYCQRQRVRFRTDASNLETYYRRNRVRLELVPLLEEYNPGLVSTLVRSGDILRSEDRYMEDAAGDLYARLVTSIDGETFILAVHPLLGQPGALQRRVLRKIWSAATGDARGLGFEHIEDIIDLMKEGKGSWEKNLPRGVYARRRYGFLYFTKTKGRKGNQKGNLPAGFPAGATAVEIPPYCYSLPVPGEVFIPETGVTVRARLLTGPPPGCPSMLSSMLSSMLFSNEALLDYDKLGPGGLSVRRRLPGDRFAPLGLHGAEIKLKKFFIDHKVPREKRDALPLVVCGDEIAWVAGERPAEKFKVDEYSEKLVHLSADLQKLVLKV